MEDNQKNISEKEEFLARLFDLEKRIFEIMTFYDEKNETKFKKCESIIESHSISFKHINKVYEKYKHNIDKIPYAIQKLSLIDEDIFTHTCKLDNISKDLNEACNKYDRFFIENLHLPGVIGEGSRFQNLRDYLDVNYDKNNSTYRIMLDKFQV